MWMIWRYRRVLAYVWLVAAVMVALGLGLANAHDERADLAEAAKRAVRVSCVAEVQNAMALREALDGQIRFVRASHEPPPPTIEQRVAAIERLKESIVVPDCEARVRLIPTP
jgi:hypothetical protein